MQISESGSGSANTSARMCERVTGPLPLWSNKIWCWILPLLKQRSLDFVLLKWKTKGCNFSVVKKGEVEQLKGQSWSDEFIVFHHSSDATKTDYWFYQFMIFQHVGYQSNVALRGFFKHFNDPIEKKRFPFYTSACWLTLCRFYHFHVLDFQQQFQCFPSLSSLIWSSTCCLPARKTWKRDKNKLQNSLMKSYRPELRPSCTVSSSSGFTSTYYSEFH